MEISNKTRFLITIQNQIGIFRAISANTAINSNNYKLVSFVDHNIKDIANIPDYLYYLIKAHKIHIAKNDVVYVKFDLTNIVYRYTGSAIESVATLKDNLIKISDFDTNEITSFINKLRLQEQVYDCVTGNIYSISELKNRKIYIIKQSNNNAFLYELYYLDNVKCEQENRLFKHATTFSNIMYAFYKKLGVNSDLVLINQKRMGSVNI